MSFWTGKAVLVTGGTGFLGGYVVPRLERAGARVTAVGSERDLCQAGAGQRLLAEAEPEVVIHLAARVGGIGANQARPAEFFYDNLMMGVPFFHACWQAGVEKFVSVGTVCCYPKHTPVPFNENDLWNGYPEETNAPYALAKKMMLVAGQAYRQQYGFNSIFLMPVNLYGPGDHIDPDTSHVIPALIGKCLSGQGLTVWGSGRATREFLYVDDAAEAIVRAAEAYSESEPVNLGSGQEIKVADLATKIARLTGFEGPIEFDRSRPDGQPRRLVDSRLAEEAFGWRATTSFDEGLARTIAWYRQGAMRRES
ncbi:MAG: GDP-L-fucose synthase family protein [Vulcanimicrobiota bacterium]